MNNIKKLKIGIIVDDVDQPFLIEDLYKKSLQSNCYSIVCLIIQKSNNLKTKNLISKSFKYLKKNGIQRLIDNIIFKLVDRIETQMIKKKKSVLLQDQEQTMEFCLIF